jgi:Radical SAM superfamily
MATPLQNYTSTGDKILYHPEAIADLRCMKNHPIVLHVMPTERCSLRCSFCSVAHRGVNGNLYPDLKLSQIMGVVYDLIPMGLKAVILSGGGEPTLYAQLNILLEMLYRDGLQVGIITNGLYFNETVSAENRQKLSWVRVSANTLDQRPNLPLPILGPETTLGLSYILCRETTHETIGRIKNLVEIGIVQGKPISYIRMLPDCNLPTADLEEAHAKLAEIVAQLGAPFFHQMKLLSTPEQCHLGRVHPVLYTSGEIFACDSNVLNKIDGEKKFDSRYALCQWDEVKEFYQKPISGSLVDTSLCPNCVFCRQNELIKDIIEGKELPHPLTDVQHVNFV